MLNTCGDVIFNVKLTGQASNGVREDIQMRIIADTDYPIQAYTKPSCN